MTLGQFPPEPALAPIDERTRALLDDVERTLRVPAVTLFFHVLASYPGYLEAAWQRTRAALRTVDFERAANDLRARSVLDGEVKEQPIEHPSLLQIRAFTATAHYLMPKLLLIASAWCDGVRSPSQPDPDSMAALPYGIARGALAMRPLPDDEVAGPVKEVFDDIVRSHDHPTVPSFYRSLANWPELLSPAWEYVRERIGTAMYLERREALIARARDHVSELPLMKIPSPRGLHPEGEQIREILGVYRDQVLPEVLLDVSIVRAMLEGQFEAHQSPFSAV